MTYYRHSTLPQQTQHEKIESKTKTPHHSFWCFATLIDTINKAPNEFVGKRKPTIYVNTAFNKPIINTTPPV